MRQTYELFRGPQDGAKVHTVGGEISSAIYVGPKWLGDGYAAWGSERCKRFPACYVRDGNRYVFAKSPVEIAS